MTSDPLKQPSRIPAKFFQAGLFAILLAGSTQYSLEVAEKTYLSIVDPLVWAVFAILLLGLLKDRAWREIPVPPAPTLLFVVFAALSMVRATSLASSLKDLIQIIEYFVAAWLIFSFAMRRERELRGLTWVFLAATTAIVAMGLAQYLMPATADFDVRATFGNRNVLGGYLSLALPLVSAFLLLDPNARRRAWYVLVLAGGVAIDLAAGSVLAVCVAVAWIAALKSRRAVIGVAGVAAALTLLVYPHLPRHNGAVLHNSIAPYDDAGEPDPRYPEWQAAAIMTYENPWLGVGVGNYQANIGGYYGTVPSAVKAAEPDTQNLYLVLASSIGLPGALSFLAMLLLFAGRATAAFYRGGNWFRRAASLGALGGILAFTVNSVWSPLLVRGIGIPLAFILSLAWAGRADKSPENTGDK